MNKLMKYSTLLITLAMFATGCRMTPEVVSQDDEVTKVPIEIETMKRDTVENIYVAYGEVIPRNQVDIFVNGNGYIEEIAVTTGDAVVEDDLLIRLDDSVADRSNYNATESQLRTVREDLKAQLEMARENLALQETLFTEGLVTKMEMDQLKLQVSSLERQYTNAAVAYNTQLAALNDTLENTVKGRMIYSSVSGTVAAVYMKEGQAVSNQMALSIVDDSALYVKTYVAGDLKKQLAVDDIVRVRLDGDEEQLQYGTVYQINDLPDMTTKLFEVLIDIDDSSTYIIGDYAEVAFIVDTYEAVLVPMRSIIRSGLDAYIYTFEEDALIKQQIETGITKGEWVEVKNLTELGQVVVKGQNQLTAGSEFFIAEK